MTKTDSTDAFDLERLPAAVPLREDIEALFPDARAWRAFLERNPRAEQVLGIEPPVGLAPYDRRLWSLKLLWENSDELRGKFRGMFTLGAYLHNLKGGARRVPELFPSPVDETS